MTTRLNPVANLADGDSIPESWVDDVANDVNYLTVAGADIASATTINPTAEFHGVTGTTTIDTITDSAGPVAGQQLRLWIKGGPLTIRNNGGGTGNVRTRTGSDRVCIANEIVVLTYDGALWREQGYSVKETVSAISGGPPASPADGDIWTATGVDTNGTVWRFRYNAGSASSYKWEFIGGSPLYTANNTGTSFNSAGWTRIATVAINRPGEYEGMATLSASMGANTQVESIIINPDNNGSLFNSNNSDGGTQTSGAHFCIDSRIVVVSAGTSIDVVASGSSSTSATVLRVSLQVIPRRIS